MNRLPGRLSRLLQLTLALWISTHAAAATFRYQVPLGAVDADQPAEGLGISPSSLSFGVLMLGSTASSSITVRNSNANPVGISDVSAGVRFSATTNCPSALAPGAACQIAVTYSPTSEGEHTELLSIESGLGALTVPLNGTGVAVDTSLQLSANSLTFPGTTVGSASTPTALTVTNAGNSVASIQGVGLGLGSDDFAQSNNCGSTLAPGASCQLMLQFAPQTFGVRTGTAYIYEVTSGALYSVGLAGSANAALLMAPGTLDFGNAIAAYDDRRQFVVLNNGGNLPVMGLTVELSGEDFSVYDSTCGAVLAEGATCSLGLRFAPSSGGVKSGTVSARSTNGGVATIALFGAGVPQAPMVEASASDLTFPDTVVGYSSVANAVALVNNGNVDVVIQSLSLTAGASHFQFLSNCGSTLQVGATCTITTTFSPMQMGLLAGTLNVAFAHGQVAIALSGTGTRGVLVAGAESVSFPATQVQVSSAVQNITLANTGNRAVTVSGLGISSGMEDFAQSNDCAVILPGATCTVSVLFTPSAGGERQGTLAVFHDGSGPTFIGLAGTGVALPSINFADIAHTSIATGETSTFSWSTADAAETSAVCTGTGGTLGTGEGTATAGSISVASGSVTGAVTCTVTATNSVGGSVTATDTMQVYAPPQVLTFSSPRTKLVYQDTMTVTWSVADAVSSSVSCSGAVSGAGSGTAAGGSLVVAGASTSGSGTCVLTATNTLGQTTTSEVSISGTLVALDNAVLKVGTTTKLKWTGVGTTQSSGFCFGAGNAPTQHSNGAQGVRQTTLTAGSTPGTGTCRVTRNLPSGTVVVDEPFTVVP